MLTKMPAKMYVTMPARMPMKMLAKRRYANHR